MGIYTSWRVPDPALDSRLSLTVTVLHGEVEDAFELQVALEEALHRALIDFRSTHSVGRSLVSVDVYDPSLETLAVEALALEPTVHFPAFPDPPGQ